MVDVKKMDRNTQVGPGWSPPPHHTFSQPHLLIPSASFWHSAERHGPRALCAAPPALPAHTCLLTNTPPTHPPPHLSHSKLSWSACGSRMTRARAWHCWSACRHALPGQSATSPAGIPFPLPIARSSRTRPALRPTFQSYPACAASLSWLLQGGPAAAQHHPALPQPECDQQGDCGRQAPAHPKQDTDAPG